MAKKAAKKQNSTEELVRKFCEDLGEKFDGIKSIRIHKAVRLAEEPLGPYWSIKIEREISD